MAEVEDAAANVKSAEKPKKGRGGARKGAGRPAIKVGMKFDWLARFFGFDMNADDLSPREIIRTAARIAYRAALRTKGVVDFKMMDRAVSYAKAAAPYYDPHLSWQALGTGRGNASSLDLVMKGGIHVYMPDNGRRLVPLPPAQDETRDEVVAGAAVTVAAGSAASGASAAAA